MRIKINLINSLKLIGIILFFMILSRLDFKALHDAVKEINLLLLVVIILLDAPLISIKALRWKLLLREQEIHYTWREAFIVYLSCLYLGIITPGRLGEFGKAIYLKHDLGVPLGKGFASVLVDRLLDFYLLVLLGMAGIITFQLTSQLSSFLFILLSLGGLPILLVGPRLVPDRVLIRFSQYLIKNKVYKNIETELQELVRGIKSFFTPQLFVALFLTCLAYLFFFGQCFLISKAMGLEISFLTLSLFMAIANLMSFLPISISGIGVRDATLIYLFSRLGLSAESAVSFSLLILIVFYLGGGIMGGVANWCKPLGECKNQDAN